MTVQELAKLTGQKESDVRAFLVCVSIWTAKGLSFEKAVAKHLEQMERIAANCLSIPKALVVETFFPQAA